MQFSFEGRILKSVPMLDTSHVLSECLSILNELKVVVVSSTYIVMGHYNHFSSFDVTTMVSKNCPTIGEHVVTIFMTQ